MRVKKGFTLAEILIVLLVIGAIATMTIPAMVKNVNSSHFKTSYRKAFSSVVNLTSMERVGGVLPTAADDDNVQMYFGTLVSYLSPKEFAKPPSITTLATEADSYGTTDFYPGVYYETTVGSTTYQHFTGAKTADAGHYTKGATSPWLITEDNMAFAVTKGGGTTSGDAPQVIHGCSSKADIIAQSNAEKAFLHSCVTVIVDVNGLIKGPNKMSDDASMGINSNKSVDNFGDGDRFYIYVGYDGATSGNKATTITGRVVTE